MIAIKGGWIGQTFALAKDNDSGGKKSRVRRSKEERKAMTESFIKKYQKLNSGSFPSLNLTHKEVGGSFYTVRKIVREIIQENRVLGPAKLGTEKQDSDQFFNEFPLGALSNEPQIHFSVSPDETCIILDHQQGTSEELHLDLNEYHPEPEQEGPDNKQFNCLNHMNGEEIDKSVQLPVSEILEAGKHDEEMEVSAASLVDRTERAAVESAESSARVLSDESSTVLGRGETEELVLDPSEQFSEPENQRFSDGLMIDGNQAAEKTDHMITSHVGETQETRKHIEEAKASTAKATSTKAGVSVEFSESAAKVSSDEALCVSSHLQDLSEELVLDPIEQFSEPENQRFSDGLMIDGNQAGEKTDHMITSHVGETRETGKYIEEAKVSAAKPTSAKVGVRVEFSESAAKVSSDDALCVSSHQQNLSEELVLNSVGQFTESMHQKFVNGKINAGDQTREENEKTDTIEAQKSIKDMEASTCKVTSITAGVTVETFPVRSALKPTESLGKTPSQALESARMLEEKKTIKVNMEFEHGSSAMMRETRHKNGCSNLDVRSSSKHSNSLENEKLAATLRNQLMEVQPGLTSSKTEESIMGDIHDSKYLKAPSLEALQKSKATDGVTPLAASDGMESANLYNATRSTGKESVSKITGTENKVKVLESHQKESNSTLDRMNLSESWVSNEAARPMTNPILAFFKALISAFVKFWSE